MVIRGQIWWAELPEPTASEPGYRRPILIIQSDDFNSSQIDTVIAVAITSNTRLAEAPGNVILPLVKTGLSQDSVANVSQIITIDKQFLATHIGQLDQRIMRHVDEGIRLVLAL